MIIKKTWLREQLKKFVRKENNNNTSVPAKTNTGLVEYCKAMLGKPYWWGTFGQKATKDLYEQKKKQYPRYYKDTDFEKQFGQRVHDCIGLIKGYLWSEDTESKPVYCSNGFKDVSADTYYTQCRRKGMIGSIPDVAGIAVFMPGHVGVYIGDGKVIEARGHKYGVVTTNLKDRSWTKWAYIDEIEYV